jgi:hypothetical protein
MGYSQAYNPSAALLFDGPGSNLPLVVQERQTGGTSRRFGDLVDFITWRRACKDHEDQCGVHGSARRCSPVDERDLNG